ncbi:membrane protein [Streptomyces nojiriensis]|uniref:Membrane protein n=1 Tax=Streptomyces nojiriensis TaxID=66374 RepID=A0ABQ3SJY4_9ACTN|nr:UbiA family prenyltransferase [Streptomyces nojiriensis]QTI50045.1 1,4-dihydroxy-2-naphthoate octaprenyltransferase [Streptomyces nojiriensis]GGS22430.1 membrane protein [Streptomyces nojiriensis]GHI68444.1 membrane protein [Streptomyces nojiriensis]
MPARTTQTRENAENAANATNADVTGSAASGPGPGPGPALVRGLAGACHPLPAAAVTLFAAALTAAAGHGPARAAVTVGAVAAGQLSVGWCNDRADLRRDLATGRRDKPLVAGTVPAAAVMWAAAVSLLLCVPLSLACGPLAGTAHLVGVAAAWAYNLRLKSTAASWVPYALAFGLLPAFVTLSLPGTPWPPPWLTAAAALLGAGAHFANVLPDIEDDLATGVAGLPQRLGLRVSAAVGGLLVIGSTATLVLGPPGPVTAYGWTLLAATTTALLLAARRPAGRLPFPATMAVAGADVILLVLELRP